MGAVQAWLEAGRDTAPLVQQIALACTRLGNDPHNQEIALCMLEDFGKNRSPHRGRLLLAPMAITSAAQRGVKVTLINSEAVDQTFVVNAQRSFYDELMREGLVGVSSDDSDDGSATGDVIAAELREGFEAFDFALPFIASVK